MLQLMIIKLRAVAKCSSVGVYLNAIFNKSLMTNMYYICIPWSSPLINSYDKQGSYMYTNQLMILHLHVGKQAGRYICCTLKDLYLAHSGIPHVHMYTCSEWVQRTL